jgi:hypothetical protein
MKYGKIIVISSHFQSLLSFCCYMMSSMRKKIRFWTWTKTNFLSHGRHHIAISNGAYDIHIYELIFTGKMHNSVFFLCGMKWSSLFDKVFDKYLIGIKATSLKNVFNENKVFSVLVIFRICQLILTTNNSWSLYVILLFLPKI